MDRLEIFAKSIALGMIEGVGPATARKLLSLAGGVDALFETTVSQLVKLEVPLKLAQAVHESGLLNLARYQAEIVLAHGGEVSHLGGEGYPARLASCADPPVVLYKKGSANLDAPRLISIVGTRKVTEYGKKITDQFIEDLAPYEVTIVSGLAYGVDIQAHRSALRHGVPTIACLGHGLATMYPGEHMPEARKMLEDGGAWVSEFPWKSKASPKNFPSRNRVIAGLSDATIVIESASKGGSMITARIASSYHREVFAVPGQITREQSSGCHRLIRSMIAHLLTDVRQLAGELGWEKKRVESQQLQLNLEMEGEERSLYEVILEKGPIHVDLLQHALGMTSSEISSLLFQMEMKGLIRLLPGQRWDLLRS
ncbi:MAG: DNA-processing protein DprA [Flavobacteriales bacterium]|nr:DNA-processing protein DprA [Flavobacteriales bacterium]